MLEPFASPLDVTFLSIVQHIVYVCEEQDISDIMVKHCRFVIPSLTPFSLQPRSDGLFPSDRSMYRIDLIDLFPSDRTYLTGAYCLYKANAEQQTDKWQPNAEMGIWIGLSKDLRGGHLVVPIYQVESRDSDMGVRTDCRCIHSQSVQ